MHDTTTRPPSIGLVRGHPALTGALAGFLWGVSMRAWMRFISTNPEFSWSGTLFILGAATIVGTVLGFAWHRRQHGGAGYWRLSLGSLLLLGAGGAVMWPAVVLGAIAIGRKRPYWLRLLAATGAIAATVPVLVGVADNWRFGVGDIVLASVWYLPMLTLEAWAFSVTFAPNRDGADTSPTARRVLIGAGVAVLALAAVLLGGIPMG